MNVWIHIERTSRGVIISDVSLFLSSRFSRYQSPTNFLEVVKAFWEKRDTEPAVLIPQSVGLIAKDSRLIWSSVENSCKTINSFILRFGDRWTGRADNRAQLRDACVSYAQRVLLHSCGLLCISTKMYSKNIIDGTALIQLDCNGLAMSSRRMFDYSANEIYFCILLPSHVELRFGYVFWTKGTCNM